MNRSITQLDLRWDIPPVRLLKATRALADLEPGQQLEIIGSDDQIRTDLLEILDARLFRIVEIEREQTFYRMVLQKMEGPTRGDKGRVPYPANGGQEDPPKGGRF